VRRLLFLLILLASSRPVYAQVPGCVNGVLADPRAYFFSQIARQEGWPANDFGPVLKQLAVNGMGVNPRPGERQSQTAPYFGITVMIDAGGNARGRIWLPTDLPETNGYYTHEIQVIADAPGGGLQWAWIDIGGAPYAPRPCSGSAPPVVVEPPVVTTPPSDGVLEAIASLRKQIENLQQALEELKAQPVTLPCFSGRIGGAVPVTLCPRQP
jgi:hypothetical protein